jgi:membrane protein DedA with SNARE-associated domain
MDALSRLAEQLADLLAHTGPAAPAILFLASLVEYVFPPFPGDLLVVLGAWYAVQGVISWPLAFLAVTAGALAGAALDHRVGRWLAPRLDVRAVRRGSLSAKRLARFVQAYQKYGALLLLANRFLPGVRAFVFVAAGAAGIPLGRVLLLGGISAMVWNALLLLAGGMLVHSLPELVQLVRSYDEAAWAVLAAALLLAALAWGLRSWLRRGGRGEGR